MQHFLTSILLASSILTACQPATSSDLHVSMAQDLEGETPREGRSLFDQITMREQDGRLVQAIPYPLTALRSQLESQMQASLVATLIPRGRSLQRQATTEPFRYPRVVMAAAGPSKAPAGELGFQLKDRLYLAYVEASQQIEVISFNPDLGRFEFQIIENYGPGLEPQVRYANREFCLACHQNEAPIFANPSWDETAANPQIQAQLIATLKSDVYLDIPVRQLRTIPNAIDDATDRANLLVPMAKLWHLGCDTTLDSTRQLCRRQSIKLALHYRLFGNFDQARFAELKPLYVQGWQRHFPTGLPILDNNIPNFNPLQDIQGGSNAELMAKLGLSVSASLSLDSSIPLAVDPLQDRKTPLETWTLEKGDPARLIFSLAEEFLDSDILWLQTFMKTPHQLDTLLDKIAAPAGNAWLKNSFIRCELLSDIARVAEVAMPRCEQRNFAAMPPAQATGQGQAAASSDPRLRLLSRYCGSCHGSGPLNFLEGEDHVVLERLATESALHLERLDWNNRLGGSMPPPQSTLRIELEARPEDKRSLQEILKHLP